MGGRDHDALVARTSRRSPARLLLAGSLLAFAIAGLSFGAFATAATLAPPPIGRTATPWWYGFTVVTALTAPVGVGLLLAAAGAWLLGYGATGSETS